MKICSIGQNFMEILFPPRCSACGAPLAPQGCGSICALCYDAIRFLQKPVCRICGVEVQGEKSREYLCGACLKKEPPFTLARSLVRYDPVVQQLVYKLKYGGDTSCKSGLVEVISRCDLSLFVDCDIIMAVPLHHQRLRERGLNQAVVLARLLFPDNLKILKLDLLERTVYTKAQTRLSGDERRKNLRGVFRLKPGKSVENRIVCLVDDVYTTGATAQECSGLLLQQGAKEVRVLTFARVDLARHGS